MAGCCVLWRVRVACVCGSASPTQFCPPLTRAGLQAQRAGRRLPPSLPARPPWEVRLRLMLVQPPWEVPLPLLPLPLVAWRTGIALPLRWVPSPVGLLPALSLRLLLPLLPWLWAGVQRRLRQLPHPAPVGVPLRPVLALADHLG